MMDKYEDEDDDDIKKVASNRRKGRFPGAASTVPDKTSAPRRRKSGSEEVRIMGAIGRGEL